MFRMYGRKVEILKYQVSYTENEEQRTDYAASEEEANEIAARVNGTVTALEAGDDAWMDGIEVADVPDTYGEAMRIYQNYSNNLEYFKTAKIAQLSQACNDAINNGMSVQLSEGVSEDFTYKLEDQSNISEMTNAVVFGADGYLYHANGADCRMYTSPEIVTMYSTLSGFKTHHQTYFNQLRAYVNSLTTIEDVNAVTYGQELTGEYLEKYNTLMAQAQVEIQKVIATLQSSI